MNKFYLIIAALVIWVTLSATQEIAVLASGSGQIELHRNGKKQTRIPSGSLLESNDELRTGADSHLGFKFLDGAPSLRLFSNSRLLLNGAAAGVAMVKKAALTKGSVFVRVSSDSSGFNLSTLNSVVTPKVSTFLVKLTPQGETQINVLSGEVIVNSPAAQAVEVVSSGKTAVVSTDGRFLVRDTFVSDITAEELAVLDPATPSMPQSLTIPLVDPQGKIKYVELSW